MKSEISESDFESDYSEARAMFDYSDSELLFELKRFVVDPLLFKQASSGKIDIFRAEICLVFEEGLVELSNTGWTFSYCVFSLQFMLLNLFDIYFIFFRLHLLFIY